MDRIEKILNDNLKFEISNSLILSILSILFECALSYLSGPVLLLALNVWH